MNRAVALPLLALAAAGCAAPSQMPARIGLSPADVLHLESEDWERHVRTSHLDPQSQAIAIRNLRCWRGGADRHLYRCNYVIDYGGAGLRTGSIPQRSIYLGRDDRGSWSFWIVVT